MEAGSHDPVQMVGQRQRSVHENFQLPAITSGGIKPAKGNGFFQNQALWLPWQNDEFSGGSIDANRGCIYVFGIGVRGSKLISIDNITIPQMIPLH